MVNDKRIVEQYSFKQMFLQMSASFPPSSSIRQEKAASSSARTPLLHTPEDSNRPKLTWAVALPDLCAQAVSRNRYVTLLQAQAVLLLRKSRRNSRLEDTGFSWCLREKKQRP